MSKTKTILAVGGAVSAILVIVAGVFAFRAFDEAASTKSSVDTNLNRLKSLYRKAPFPESGNITVEKKNADEIARRFGILTNIVMRGAVEYTENMSGGAFVTANEAAIRALRDAAPKDADGKSAVPDNFYFGFERYDSARGQSPDRKDVPRLMRQLTLVDALTRELYKAGIVGIRKISRDEFEGSESGSGGTATGGGGRGRPSSGGGVGAVNLGDVVSERITDAPVPVSRERFGFLFTTREAGLVNILNRLNAFEPFVMVNKVEFQKEVMLGDVVWPPPPAPVLARNEETPGPPPVLYRPADISGPLREGSVVVSLIVDVYDFADRPAATAGPQK